MEPLPRYESDGSEEISYQDIWREISPQEVLGADCFMPDVQIYPDENLINMKLTALEFREMFSALYFGAELSYPERFMQILVNFLKGIYCPPIIEDEKCTEYPLYASFISYPLQNPYSQPDYTPEGYLLPPLTVVTDENEGSYPDSEIGDVVVNFNSFPLDSGWFDELDGDFPSVQIRVQGSGKVEVEFTPLPQGGLAIVTVDNPPDLVDILAGIITGADNIMDVNKDVVSFPPETVDNVVYPVEVVGAGEHIVYIVFFPIIDDSVIPLRFGGGIRKVGLCGFLEEPDMGIQDLRYNDSSGQIEALIGGEWIEKIDAYYMIENAVNPVIDTRLIFEDNVVTAQHIRMTDDNEWRDVGSASFEILTENVGFAQATADAAQATADAALAAANDAQSSIDGYVDEQDSWIEEFDFRESDYWNGGLQWDEGEGILIDLDNETINHPSMAIDDNRVLFIEVQIKRKQGAAGSSGSIEYPGGSNHQNFQFPSSGDPVLTNWIQVNEVPYSYGVSIKFDIPTPTISDRKYWVQRVRIFGKGTNPF